VILGAGSGIGRAVCQAFAREGARLAAVDLHEKGLAPVLSLPGKIVGSLPINLLCYHESFESFQLMLGSHLILQN